MIVVGIDPGSNATGYAFINASQNQLKVLEYGAIRSKPKETLGSKLMRIHNTLSDLMSVYRPKHMALESAFVASYPKAALVLGHTRGAIMVSAYNRGVLLFEYSPRLVKRAVTGLGRASKQQIALMVQRHFSLTTVPQPADAADALAIGYCHLLQQRLLI